MSKLIIIIEKEKWKDNGTMTKIDMVGDKELWKIVKEEVLREFLDKLNNK